jgi:hypothetical protein
MKYSQVKNFKHLLRWSIYLVMVMVSLPVVGDLLSGMDGLKLLVLAMVTLLVTATVLRNEITSGSFLKIVLVLLAIFGLFRSFVLPIQRGDISKGVSNAAFFGTSPKNATLISLLIVVILVSTRILFVKGTNPAKAHQSGVSKNIEVFGKFSTLLFTINFINNRWVEIQTPQTNIDFDALNISTWDYFYAVGRVPMKDFWYPYGGMIFLRNGVLGIILSAIAIGTLIFFFNQKLIKSQMHVALKIGFLAIVPLLAFADWLKFSRYILPFAILILFFDKQFRNRSKAVIAVMLGGVFFLSAEVALLIFLLLSFFLFSDLFLSFKRNLSLELKRYSMPFVGALIALVAFAQNGALPKTIHMLLHSDETSQLVTSIDFGARQSTPIFRSSSVIIIIVIAITIFYFPKRSEARHYIQNFEFRSTLIIFLMLLYSLNKELARGGMLYVAVFGLYMLLLFVPQGCFGDKKSRSKRVEVISRRLPPLALTFCILFSGVTFAYAQAISNVVKFPGNLWDSRDEVGKLFLHNQLNDPKSFDPEVKKFTSLFGDDSFSEIFVLGDRSTFYWDSDSPNYWAISNWSTSSDQRILLAQLQKKSPKYVYLDLRPVTLQFDRIQPFLRSPSLYKYVYENYQFIEHGVDGDFLVRKDKSNPIDKAYWAKVFGASVNLGLLPYASSFPDYCYGNVDCTQYLYLAKGFIEPLAIEITCNSGRYELILQRKFDKVGIYPLNNIWFWDSSCLFAESIDFKVIKRGISDEMKNY